LTIKNTLLDYGFFEVINNPFINVDTNNAIKVDNPLDSNREYIRTNLKKSLIDNLLFNERRQQDSIKLFEIADVYYFKEEIKNKKMLGIICSGRVGRNYRDFSKKIDKNFLTNIIKKLSPEINLKPTYIERKGLDTKSSNQIVYVEFELEHLKNYNFENLSNVSKKLSSDRFIKFNPISEYPSSSRDLSFSIKNLDKYCELEEHLFNYQHDLIKEIFIFDFFDNKKNNEIKIGFRFTFQSKISTITEGDVNSVMEKIIKSSLAIDSVSIPGL
jgi:phenylalanyl-tRNA synthetase beta chain